MCSRRHLKTHERADRNLADLRRGPFGITTNDPLSHLLGELRQSLIHDLALDFTAKFLDQTLAAVEKLDERRPTPSARANLLEDDFQFGRPGGDVRAVRDVAHNLSTTCRHSPAVTGNHGKRI